MRFLLMKKFDEENVAAVAGNVKVGNEVNMITAGKALNTSLHKILTGAHLIF